jgi:hypothetical protein
VPALQKVFISGMLYFLIAIGASAQGFSPRIEAAVARLA